MGKAFRLAAGLSARRFADLTLSCLLGPSAAARELVARPARWWPGAALLWVSLFLPHGNGFSGWFWGLCSSLFLAHYTRPTAGPTRWLLWITLWGYSLLPGLVSRLVEEPLFAAIVRSSGPARDVLVACWWALGLLTIFATLRLLMHLVREAAGSGWGRACGVAAFSFFGGMTLMLLAESALRLIPHG